MSAELTLAFEVEKLPASVAELVVTVSPDGQTLEGVVIVEFTTMLPFGTSVVGTVEG
jgi:hypothetical protein